MNVPIGIQRGLKFTALSLESPNRQTKYRNFVMNANGYVRAYFPMYGQSGRKRYVPPRRYRPVGYFVHCVKSAGSIDEIGGILKSLTFGQFPHSHKWLSQVLGLVTSHNHRRPRKPSNLHIVDRDYEWVVNNKRYSISAHRPKARDGNHRPEDNKLPEGQQCQTN